MFHYITHIVQPSLGSETATSGALLLPFFGALEKGEGADGPAGPPWMNDRQILKIGPKSTDLSFFSRIFTTGIKTNICWKKRGNPFFKETHSIGGSTTQKSWNKKTNP
jgi:hypothetical protein